MRFTRHNDSHALDDFWTRVERDWRRPGSGRTASETTAAPVDGPAETVPATASVTAPAISVDAPTTGAVPPAPDAADAASLLTGTAPAARVAALTRHDGTIQAESGDVIENLDIYADGAGIEIEGDANVTIRNVRIHYNGADQGGSGIEAIGAQNLTVDGVEIINAGAPASGPNSDPEQYGIGLFESPGASVSHVTVRDASTGLYLQDSPDATLQGIEGYNMRGPYPRGQLVQFNRSDDSSLTDFYSYNDLETSWTEDNVNVSSSNVTVADGLIDGNNSPSGVGVIVEGGTGVRVSNVDTVRMGDGAFSDYGSGNSFDDVRAFDNFAESHAGRGTPMSGALIFALADDSTVTDAAYQNPAVPGNIVYGGGIQDDAFGGTFEAREITGETPMAAYHNTFAWS